MTWPTPPPPGVVHPPSITPGAPGYSPKVTKKVTKMTRSHLASLVMGKKGKRHLKSITCLVHWGKTAVNDHTITANAFLCSASKTRSGKSIWGLVRPLKHSPYRVWTQNLPYYIKLRPQLTITLFIIVLNSKWGKFLVSLHLNVRLSVYVYVCLY